MKVIAFFAASMYSSLSATRRLMFSSVIFPKFTDLACSNSAVFLTSSFRSLSTLCSLRVRSFSETNFLRRSNSISFLISSLNSSNSLLISYPHSHQIRLFLALPRRLSLVGYLGCQTYQP